MVRPKLLFNQLFEYGFASFTAQSELSSTLRFSPLATVLEESEEEGEAEDDVIEDGASKNSMKNPLWSEGKEGLFPPKNSSSPVNLGPVVDKAGSAKGPVFMKGKRTITVIDI